MLPLNLLNSDCEKVTEHILEWIKDYCEEAGVRRLIIGISGGIDSTLTTCLISKAIGGEDVYAYSLPSKITDKSDIEDARLVAELYKTNFEVVPITDFIEPFSKRFPALKKLTFENLQARIRMVLLYKKANELDGLVVGTSNRTEDLLGFTTKYGDNACDIAPIKDLYKTQVRRLAIYHHVLDRIVLKKPSPGLSLNQTDEGVLADILGLKRPEKAYEIYEILDKFLYYRFELGRNYMEASDIAGIGYDVGLKIEDKCRKSMHKRKMPPSPDLRGL